MFFRFGNDPNALPEEGHGFGNWLAELEEGEENEENEDYNNYERSGTIESACGEYIYEFFETDNDHGTGRYAVVYGKMIRKADQTLVAVINGELLTRSSSGGLYSLADEESQELIELARFCCNDNGSLRKPLRAAIKDPTRVKAATRGGLLFLDEVHVLPSFRGRDLSLELSLALFRYLDTRWSLVVSVVVPYAFEDQQTDQQNKRTKQRTAEERTQLCRHFARLGLKQVAHRHRARLTAHRARRTTHRAPRTSAPPNLRTSAPPHLLTSAPPHPRTPAPPHLRRSVRSTGFLSTRR